MPQEPPSPNPDLGFPRAWSSRCVIIPELLACQVWVPQNSKSVSLGSTDSAGESKGPGRVPACHLFLFRSQPQHHLPSTCNAIDCEQLGYLRPEDRNRVSVGSSWSLTA